ncbi:MAG: transcriptional activator domain-containing protein [Actinobacteria bacterium]|nr:transcriptional activator domain-containing protein [Actinomycetota bacterium]
MAEACGIDLLGRFRVSIDGRVISPDAWRNRRAADVVKLLALAPRHRLHREQVMESLWPTLDPDAAASNLRKAVHFARRAMEADDAIHTSGRELALWQNGPLEVDVDRFDEAVDAALSSGLRADAAAAAELYGGELLPADRFEPWSEEPRTRLDRRHLRMLKLAEEWQRVIDLDVADEEAHRALMQADFDSGRRTEAIRQFEILRRALRDELGVTPDPATVSLYEKVLGMEGPEPPTPTERAQALLAWGLIHWNRKDLDDAETRAREARTLALIAGLGHELGEASTLLALIAFARGTWHDVFREEFGASMQQGDSLAMAVYDAHLCFAEYYMYGPEGPDGAEAYARELLSIASRAASVPGEALSRLLLGEILLSRGRVKAAETELEQAMALYASAGVFSGQSISLERMAEMELLRGRREQALRLVEKARPFAERSGIPTHLVVRVFGVLVAATEHAGEALAIVEEAERRLAQVRVCEPCSMGFLVSAAIASARAGDLDRARRYVADAERISLMWQGGPWVAAVWEARGVLREAEGDATQAAAFFREAADGFAAADRPLDEARCRSRSVAVAPGARSNADSTAGGV